MNLEVESFGSAGASVFAFARQVSGSGLVVPTANGFGTGTATSAQVANMTTNGVAVTYTPQCGGEYLIKNLGKKWVTVAAAFTKVGGGFNDTYSQGQESSLGVAVSQGTSGTGWSAGGTMSKSSSASQGFGPNTHSPTYFRTLFSYGQYQVICGQHHHRC